MIFIIFKTLSNKSRHFLPSCPIARNLKVTYEDFIFIKCNGSFTSLVRIKDHGAKILSIQWWHFMLVQWLHFMLLNINIYFQFVRGSTFKEIPITVYSKYIMNICHIYMARCQKKKTIIFFVFTEMIDNLVFRIPNNGKSHPTWNRACSLEETFQPWLYSSTPMNHFFTHSLIQLLARQRCKGKSHTNIWGEIANMHSRAIWKFKCVEIEIIL